jgi:hypothetical protein
MPSKRTLIFGAAIVVAVFFISNQAAKNPNGILAKVKAIGS